MGLRDAKIALISDVHGNLPALEAVLQDAASEGIDCFWNLGDFTGYGPYVNEVIDLLRETNALSIVGNYDRKVLAFPQKKHAWKRKKSPEKFAAFQWAYQNLRKCNRRFLASLPLQRRTHVENMTILLVHGSPTSINEALGPDTAENHLTALAEDAKVDVIVHGHTHRPSARYVGRVCFVNPGSVGRPEGGDPRACYSILRFEDGMIKTEERRIAYDVDRIIRAIHAAGLPAAFAEMFRQGRNLVEVEGDRSMDDNLPEENVTGEQSGEEQVAAYARQCGSDEPHAQQVTRLALRLFDELDAVHGLDSADRELLHYAGLLHDIGWIQGQKGHHKTSRDMILREERLPLDDQERLIVALVARYHRKATPRPGHKYFKSLSAPDQKRVRLLGGLLRLADGLDRSHGNLIEDVHCEVSDSLIRVMALGELDAEEDIQAARKKADLIEEALGKKVEVIGAPDKT